jgi:indolepyruvate ferredoxin oxidoreductase beta subunit
MSKTTNIIMVGIGGQGTLTMMEMLALAAEEANEEVRVLSRVSLARLGGSGMCHVRLGPSVSPAIPVGEADVLLTLEMSEILRVLPMARRGALAFINTFRRLPIAAGVAGIQYPKQEEIKVALDEAGVAGIFVPEILPSPSGEIEDGQQSNSRINIIMLGVFCSYTQLLPSAVLENAITSRLPQYAEQNLRTFSAGWGFAESLRAQNMA